MSFNSIRDQEVALTLLRNVLIQHRVPNGLLFWGADGVGKRSTALEFAKALNCEKADGDACDVCLSCRKVASGNHPDIKIVSPVKKSRNIDVETIEGINEMASLRAFEGKWRVFIVLEADRMREPAQNHFLKTLEEPAGRSVFILVSEFPRQLLPTIRSRCQMVRFRALRPDTIVSLLQQGRDLADDVALAVAQLSQGQMSRAIDLVDTERREIALAIPDQLAAGDDPSALADEFIQAIDAQRKNIEAALNAEADSASPSDLTRDDKERMKEERLAVVDALARRDILEFLYLLETWYRDEAVLAATGRDDRIMNLDCAARIRRAVSSNPGAKIDAIERAREYLDRFINEERVFRDLFFALSEK
jgi:DNA polymerase-3 subunit delta'